MGVILAPEAVLADDTTVMRFMSMTVRDQPLTVAEAQAIALGQTTLDAAIATWLEEDSHQERIRRYFNDQFGANDDFSTVSSNFFLKLSNGIYYLEDKGACTAENATTITDAWWLEGGDSALVCSNTTGGELVIRDASGNVTRECTDAGTNGIGHADCGCGPYMILCYPDGLRSTLRNQLRYQFQERGWFSYDQNKTWLELLGGNYIYATRLIYKYYLDTQALFRGISMTDSDYRTLMSLGINTYTEVTPPVSGAVERAGLVTTPIFLKQYNNFRSRINILTARLLCQDVDASLNTGNIATFVNTALDQYDPDFGAAHGSQESCSGCHYPMDNMGSTIMIWNQGGWFMYFGAEGEQNVLGHSFGQDGSGPAFLARSFVELATGFHSCMAKTVFEDFAGGVWDELSTSTQNSFVALSQQGPRTLIRGIIQSTEIQQLHNAGLGEVAIGSSTIYSFAEDVNPILQSSCSGISCHSQGTTLGSQYEFVDNEAVFGAVTSSRIDDGTMPPSNSGLSISTSDQAILKEWRDSR